MLSYLIPSKNHANHIKTHQFSALLIHFAAYCNKLRRAVITLLLS
jgi:hypothetical protein